MPLTTSVMRKHRKMTILPIDGSDWGLALPIPIADDLIVDTVEGVLQPNNFDLWHDYVAKKNRENLSSTKVGVIHRFSSDEHIGKAQFDSQDAIYKTFELLRLLRP